MLLIHGGLKGLDSVNDPSAGSPTETLLRLLLPLNAQIWESFRATMKGKPSKGPVQIPH